MAYVEETVPDERIQDYSEHLLFTVPDNWDPPTCFENDAKPPAPGMTHSSRENDPAEDYTSCYVEEELPDNTEEKANTTSGEPPEEATQQDKQQGQQGGNANKSKGETDAQKLIRLSSAQEEWQEQPPFIHSEHLELIFETRSMVEDQIFRAIQINKRLDMMYTAYSSTSPRRQCPTCAQAYTIPIRPRKIGKDDENTE